MGYTQDDVAYLLGLHSKTEISRWEKGTTIPQADNVIRLAYVYHTFTEELFREYYKKVRCEIEPREKRLINQAVSSTLPFGARLNWPLLRPLVTWPPTAKPP